MYSESQRYRKYVCFSHTHCDFVASADGNDVLPVADVMSSSVALTDLMLILVPVGETFMAVMVTLAS